MTSSKRFILGAASAAIVSVIVGCAPQATEDVGDSSSKVETGFDKNSVISDVALLDKDALTADQIQSFLESTPWKTKSVLATYTENGQTAAQIISLVSTKYGVNPIALLTRVQMEQSLVYKATASADTIKIAFGCGCPHSSVCSEKYEGFANQADCAAGTLSRSLAAATTTAGTAGGWKKGVAKTTLDNVSVTPANAATAALYTYTPYVSGATLHSQVWEKLTTALSYTPTARSSSATTASSSTTTTTGSTSDGGTDTSSTGDDSDDSTDTSAGSTGTSTGTTTAAAASASGADDSKLAAGASAPPAANNVPLPQSSGTHKSSSSATTTSGDDSTSNDSASSSNNSNSSDDSTSSKKVASGGCSSTGHEGGGSSLFAGMLVVLGSVFARRRRGR